MIKRKLNKIIIVLIIIVTILSYNRVLSDDENESENDNCINAEEMNKTKETSSQDLSKEPLINSRKYVIYDRESGIKVYGKNEDKETAMASTTKIMTAIIVLENCTNLEEKVIVDTKAATTGGSRLGLKKDDTITVNDLLYGLLMKSGNDAAVALAIHTSGSKEEFANKMNEKAKELNLKHTHFVTPHGLDDPNHYTTAYELAKLTDYALNNNKFSEIVKTTNKTIKINNYSKNISNTNELLNSNIEGVYGVKTGFTNIAGRCLVTAVKRKDMNLIIVVLGADTRKDRAKDTLKLMNYVYNNFRIENIEEKVKDEFDSWTQINKNRIMINKGRENIELNMEEIPVKSIVTNKETTIQINIVTCLEAPIKNKTKIGTVIVKNNNEVIEEINVTTTKEINRKNPLDYLYLYAKLLAK